MSGGHFDYNQRHIRDIAYELERDIYGYSLDEDDIKQMDVNLKRGWIEKDFYDYCVEHKHTPPCTWYKEETIDAYKTGYVLLRLAEIYAQRIDWLESCDDSEDSFHRRLCEELHKLGEELSEKGLGNIEINLHF